MGSGPSPTSTSPSNLSNSPYLHGSFSSTSSSPPHQSFSPQHGMTADDAHSFHKPMTDAWGVPMDLKSLTSSMSHFGLGEAESVPETKGLSAILLRKLPNSSDRDAVNNILLFAKDLIDCELLPTKQYFPEDIGFACAIARFRTLDAAKEARDRLNGKRNATKDANLIVELVQDGIIGTIGSRRNTVDSASTRQGSVSTASGIAVSATNGRQSSRYNNTFQQNLEKMSPQNGTPGLGNGEFASSQPFFSPTSPVSSTFARHNMGDVGKTLITGDCNDDDDGLLNESIGFATGSAAVQPVQRRQTNPTPSLPGSRYGQLSLNTNGVNGIGHVPQSAYTSPQSTTTIQSPRQNFVAMSPQPLPPVLHNYGPNGGYQSHVSTYSRNNYPPVNPADQNPPCNTLYVGNLPIDTNEDELKAVFSKQRGYKRLCFRTKQNGPMCFVEFEDISFATKALNELYGHMLHNSIKGGIRLSFSKNPLGVRNNGNQAGMGPASLNPAGAMSGFGSAVSAPPGFGAATGPPPGLPAPPGLHSNANGSSPFGMYSNGGFGSMQNDVRPQSIPPTSMAPSNGFASLNGNYAYMNGRDMNGREMNGRDMNGRDMNGRDMNGHMNGRDMNGR